MVAWIVEGADLRMFEQGEVMTEGECQAPAENTFMLGTGYRYARVRLTVVSLRQALRSSTTNDGSDSNTLF